MTEIKDNLQIYEASRAVPKNAKKPILGGRLTGKTDINPMFRIKKLTELFGPCGIGWKTEIVKKELVIGANNEMVAFVDINLYIKVGDSWSDAIPGTGGSSFIAIEKGKLYTSDECYKMAYTDALSVSCKLLGIGADVYWEEDRTKYTKDPETTPEPKQKKQDNANQPQQDNASQPIKCEQCGKNILPCKTEKKTYTVSEWTEGTVKVFGAKLCYICFKDKMKEWKNAAG